MKQLEPTSRLLRLLAFLALVVTTTVQADENTSATRISYDKAADHLSVTAEAASLKLILGKIALQSGMEVLFDDAADETVSFKIQSVSLEDGVKQILKGRNHILSYDKNKQGKRLLVGAMILPAGEQDTGRAKRLITMDDEAYYRAQSQLSLGQVQQIDMASERWQSRLSKMPPQRREAMEKRIHDRLLKDALRKERREKQKEKFAQARAKREKERLERQESMLQRLSPEQRAVFEERRKAASEEMRINLLNNPDKTNHVVPLEETPSE